MSILITLLHNIQAGTCLITAHKTRSHALLGTLGLIIDNGSATTITLLFFFFLLMTLQLRRFWRMHYVSYAIEKALNLMKISLLAAIISVVIFVTIQ